jgi:HK97 family phage major capsid protein
MTASRFLVGRYLQAKFIGNGSMQAAAAFAESQGHWIDRVQVIGAIKANVSALEASDISYEYVPVSTAFLQQVRPYSVPQRLQNLRRTPIRTRVLLNTAGVTAGLVAAGAAIPVLRGTWDSTTLAPKIVAGIVVQTEELLRSSAPAAAAAITEDLAQAVAEAENRQFLSPAESGSILDGASHFTGTGSSVATVDADLRELVSRVPGAWRPGACFVMTMETATYLGTLRDSDGAAAYPGIGPQGGTLLGLPVLISTACEEASSPPTRIVALLDPSDILYAAEPRAMVDVSGQTALQMDDAPTASAATPSATNAVSMYQTHAVATRALIETGWYARSGAAAYFVAGY